MGGVLVGLCVVILAGPNKNVKGTASDYSSNIYTVESVAYPMGRDSLGWLVKTKVHENNVRQCTTEEENENNSK
jgi:hypothetical protein